MSEADIEQARLRAADAKARFSEALAALKTRLLPRTIARHLVDTTKEKASDAAEASVEAIKAKPAVAVGAAALIALFLARKPLKRAISSDNAETPAVPARSFRNSVRKAKR